VNKEIAYLEILNIADDDNNNIEEIIVDNKNEFFYNLFDLEDIIVNYFTNNEE
ncbi:14154_t:CDS:1, partial [Racocetra fulgida]